MTESMIERVGAAVDGELKRLGLLQNISVGNVIAPLSQIRANPLPA